MWETRNCFTCSFETSMSVNIPSIPCVKFWPHSALSLATWWEGA
jgi:hypothetical protein